MRVHSYQAMLAVYETHSLEDDEELFRNSKLEEYPYSVIVEGGYMELESLEKWMNVFLGSVSVEWTAYSKIGYDFCFAEYFFKDELNAKSVENVIPHIYTTYPLASPPRAIKSNGYDEIVNYDPKDPYAILFK
jgi:hypothetical protein